MKDIIMVTGSMIRGGAEGVLASVANGLAQRGWKIHIVSILFDQCDYVLHPSIEYISIAKPQNNQILDTPRMVGSLRKVIKELKPDVVISFMVTINIVTWMSTRGLNVKYIPSERNDPDKGVNGLIKLLQDKAYGAADVVVFQTTRAKEFFSYKIQQKGVIIPNPVKKMPEASSIKSKRIVTVGRLENQKNQKLLIDSFKEIYDDNKEFSVEIYGDGSLMRTISDYIKQIGLEGIVRLCGKVENIPEKIRDAYMFVLPSDYEGLSNALLEAMAIGLPCITTNCAGSDDAIQDGVNGLIVPVRDQNAMVKAMRRLLDNPSEASDMGIKARQSMDRYNYDYIIDQWELVLKK